STFVNCSDCLVVGSCLSSATLHLYLWVSLCGALQACLDIVTFRIGISLTRYLIPQTRGHDPIRALGRRERTATGQRFGVPRLSFWLRPANDLGPELLRCTAPHRTAQVKKAPTLSIQRLDRPRNLDLQNHTRLRRPRIM